MPGSIDLHHTTLVAGDRLLLYTDGLVESRGDVDEGERRLVHAARTHATHPVGRSLSAIVEDMHDVVRHTDDTFLPGVRFRGHV